MDKPPANLPAAHEGSPLALETAVSWTLEPTTEGGGSWIAFRSQHGTAVLRCTDLYAHDAEGQRLDAWLTVTGNTIGIHVHDRSARYPITIDPLVWTETNRLTASDANDGPWFGWTVAISDLTAVIGASQASVLGSNSGAAYVYERDHNGTDVWGERIKLTASDGGPDDFGSSVAIDVDGTCADVADGSTCTDGLFCNGAEN